MEIGILGTLEVRSGGRALQIAGSRLRALLTRLAVDAPAAVSTAELIDAVWPGGAPAEPVNALQSLISRVRRVLGEPGSIQQVAGGYRLAVDRGAVDAAALSDLVSAGRRAFAGRCDGQRAGHPGQGAVAVARGPAGRRGRRRLRGGADRPAGRATTGRTGGSTRGGTCRLSRSAVGGWHRCCRRAALFGPRMVTCRVPSPTTRSRCIWRSSSVRWMTTRSSNCGWPRADGGYGDSARCCGATTGNRGPQRAADCRVDGEPPGRVGRRFRGHVRPRNGS